MADEDENNPQPLYEDDEPDSSIFRWMSALIVILAVAGFFGLAWYAYKSGGDNVDEKDVELVKADATPVKEAPANPGGMQIPNQDKTVYGLISGKTEKPVVERILPAPEEPMARASGDTETWMSDSFKGRESSDDSGAKPTVHADGTPIAPKEQFNPAKIKNPAPAVTSTPAAIASDSAATGTATTKVATATPQSLPVIPPAASAPVAPPAPNSSTGTVASSAAPQPKPPAPPAVAAKPAADDSDDADEEAQKTPPAKPASPVTAAAPAATTAPAGVRVQLGAFKSQGEAEGTWKKIASRFSDDVSGKQHYIVRADLGAKGIYYRLQLAPFASSSAAEQFCIDFVSSGQGCIVARGK